MASDPIATLLPEVDRAALAELEVLIPTGYGLNCEAETAAAFSLLGAKPVLMHLSDLLAEPKALERASILAFIGGFSFGDHVASGRVYANRMRFGLGSVLADHVAGGGLAIGMCNGFQVMTKLGLLPGPLDGPWGEGASALPTQTASVVGNDRLGYRNGWVTMRCDPDSPCVWTRGLDRIDCPSRHGEGKIVFAEGVGEQLEAERRIVLRYVDDAGQPTEAWPANPNGSAGGAAGLCDQGGRVFGLMPHPEAFLYPQNHPRWIAQRDAGELPEYGLGLRIFANGLRAALPG